MKRIVMCLMFFVSTFAWARQAAGDYPVTVHVQSSQIDLQPGPFYCLRLRVVIDGKKYVLEDDHRRKDLLRVGDYKAKIVSDETKKPYEYSREYELLLPDGEKRRFLVIGESE